MLTLLDENSELPADCIWTQQHKIQADNNWKTELTFMPVIIWTATKVILSFLITEIYKYELVILIESVHGKS